MPRNVIANRICMITNGALRFTAPIEPPKNLSETFRQLRPLSVVFHTPPPTLPK